MRDVLIIELTRAVQEVVSAHGKTLDAADLPMGLEPTKSPEHGDLASNVAFPLARILGRRPIEIARTIVEGIRTDCGLIDRMSVAAPGFINFTLSDRYWHGIIRMVLTQGDAYGRCTIGRGKRALVEFVSANPTGPLHIGHGRCAAFGDVLSNLLAIAGYDVEREYYINDAGRQMDLLGKSILSRYMQQFDPNAPFPEDGYKGDYIKEIAEEIYRREGDIYVRRPEKEAVTTLTRMAADSILQMIKDDLQAFGIVFDRWFSEQSLYDSGKVAATIELLRKRGFIYDQDGAQWMKASCLGDQKDRVIIRSNGEPTYFASDIAYHQDKYERGFDRTIDIWGADHHGYVDRIKAVLKALDHPKDSFSALLVQMVKLIRNGTQIDMSTRQGTFTTLEEVVKEVGRDAARFFFLLRRHDSHLDFDLDLAKEHSAKNPVFYCQYAHARICSIEKKAEDKGIPLSGADADFSLLRLEEEREIIKKLDAFPYLLINAVQALEPHRITFYLLELSTLFHKYYNAHRVVSRNRQLTLARMQLIEAVKIVIRNCLALLGVSAPETM
ncbi:MAG: arginine--tRNA ligase [bacterium]